MAGELQSDKPHFLKTWLAPLVHYSPPGLLYAGLKGALFPAVLGLLLQAAVFGLLLLPLLRRKYLGEVTAETAAPRAAVQVQPGWQLPGLPPLLSAMLEKEVRYLLGQSQAALGFLMVPFMAVMAALGTQVQKFLATIFRVNSDSLYPGLAGFLVLTCSSWAYNSFCFEGHGFDRWVLAPVRFRQVILAKNLMLGALILGNFVLITAVLSLSPGLAAARVATVSAIVVFAMIVTISTGNFFAVWSPSGVDYEGMRSRKVSELGVLGAVLSQFVILALLALIFYAVARWELDWLPQMGLLLLLDAGALAFYLFSLDYTARYATAKHDVMASRLY
jgi:ABC-2 type transport system permease protein